MNKQINISLIFLLSTFIFIGVDDAISQTISILPLGNSITEGTETLGTPSEGQKIAYRYALYTQLTGAGYDFNFIGHKDNGYEVFSDSEHGGIPGTRDQYLVRLLQDGYDQRWGVHTTGGQPYLDVYPADLILLQVGTNDITHGEGSDPGTVSLILDEIDAWEASTGNEVSVIVARIISRNDNSDLADTTTLFNDKVEAMVAARMDDDISVVDIENGAGIDYPTELSTDNIHPLPAAYAKMGDKWYTAVGARLTAAPDVPTGLAATSLDDDQIQLSWTDDANLETGYRIERSETSGSGFSLVTTLTANSEEYTDSGLTDGAIYYYRVRANGSVLNSSFSGEASATTALLAPTGLSATALDDDQIQLSWDDNSDSETGYRIERSETSGGSYSFVTTVAAGSEVYTNSGLSDGTTYYYQVRANGGVVNSSYSVEATATTALLAPTGLSATALDDDQIQLSWSDISDNETGYRIERSEMSGSGFSFLTTVTAGTEGYTNSGLTDGTTYYFQVRANGDDINSSYSPEASAITELSAPSGLTATSTGDSQIQLSWDDNSDSETTYRIERSTSSGSGFTQLGSITADQESYTDNTVLDGTDYYYRVRAAMGMTVFSAYSGEASASASLAAPTGLLATALDDDQIQLSWDDNSDSETGYRIERSETSGGSYSLVTTVAAESVGYTNSGLTDGTTYYYQVRANGDGVNSSYSGEASATTALLAPTGLSATALDDDQIQLSWSDISDSESGYRIERSETSGGSYSLVVTVAAGSEGYINSGLTDGTTYYYQVRANGDLVNSPYSVEANATTGLSAPTGLAATAMGDSQIQLSWDDNSDSETTYRIERSTSSGSGFTQLGSIVADQESYTDNTAVNGTDYYYRVRAAMGMTVFSAYSGEASASASLAAPTNLSATAPDDSQIQLSWDDNSDSETGYRIERSSSSGTGFSEVGFTTADQESYTDNSVQNGTTYYYRVRSAMGATVFSAYSNEASASTDMSAPTALSATALDDSQIQLSWTDNALNETSYRIERSQSSGTGFGPIGLTVANQESYTDNTAQNGTTYYYRVRAARGTTVFSAYSSEAFATTDMSAPTGLSATALNDTQIQLSWTDIAENETSYRIERSSSSGTGFSEIDLIAANQESYTDNTALNGTTYYYRVRAARGTTVFSAYSSEAFASTPMSAPTGLSTTVLSENSIQLNWTDNAIGESNYRIERSVTSGSGFSQIGFVVANLETYTDNTATDGTTYYYQVRAARGTTEFSAYSDEVSAFTALLAPSNLTAAAVDDQSIQLNWEDNSESESGYLLERSTTTGSGFVFIESLPANTTAYLDEGLEDETEYFYQLRATRDMTVFSTYSNEASATTELGVPEIPTDLTGTATNTCNIDLSWVDASDNEDGFDLVRSLSPSFSDPLLVQLPADTESYSDIAATVNGETYYYRIRAYNLAGDSDYSSTERITISVSLNGGLIGVDQLLCPLGDPELIANQILPSGGSESWTYQWQSRVSPGLFADIPGGVSNFYDPPEGMMETSEFQRISTVECGSVSSNVVTITVEDLEAPVFDNCPEDLIIDIERDALSIIYTPEEPVVTDNCELLLQTWTLSGAVTASSPLIGIHTLGATEFPLGVTTVTYYVEDYMGNSAQCVFMLTVKIKDPEVLQVSIPDAVMNIGSVIPATITVGRDGGTEYSMLSGNIGGYPLESFQRVSETTYLANFVITEGGNSYEAIANIPVGNLVITDGNVQSIPYVTPISQSNDLLDASRPLVISVEAVSRDYKIGDLLVLNITADGELYGIDEATTINGIASTEPNIIFTELGSGRYTLSYEIMEGDMDVGTGELTATVIMNEFSRNIGLPYTAIGNIDLLSVDAHPPVISTIEAPTAQVGVRGVVELTVTADGEGYVAETGTSVNGIPLGSDMVSFEEVGGGLYLLSYTVSEGDREVAPGGLGVNLVLSDFVGNITDVFSTVETNGLEVYSTLPTAVLIGVPVVCEGDPVGMQVFYTGLAPWGFHLFNGTDSVVYSDLTGSSYEFEAYPTEATNYTISQVLDKNGVWNVGTGNNNVSVNAKTEVEFVNLATGYNVETAPFKLEANIPGGDFSGIGVNSGTGYFSPAEADTVNSPHTLYYTYLNSSGCTSVASALVFVLGAEGVLHIPNYIICGYSEPFKAQASNVAGVIGDFTLLNEQVQEVSGLTDYGDNTAEIDPSQLSDGIYTIEYKYFDEVWFYLRTHFVVEVVPDLMITSLIDTVFCQNDPVVPLTANVSGAVFSGKGVIGNVSEGFYFDPSLAELGSNTIDCEFETENGCNTKTTRYVVVQFTSKVNFTIGSSCLPVGGGAVQFNNLSDGKVLVESWSWSFDDPGSGANNYSAEISPEHVYQLTGDRSITLSVSTIEGCNSSFVLDTTFNSRPSADFTWISDCHSEEQGVEFKSLTSSGESPLESLKWVFMTESGDLIGEQTSDPGTDIIEYQFEDASSYLVDFIAANQGGCADTIRKEIELRPTVKLSSEGYEELFDTDPVDWTIESEDENSSWVWGVPDFNGFVADGASRSWYTDLPSNISGYMEHSWVQSPCFDFSEMDNPLIRLDIMRSFVPNINGVVLQYMDVREEGWKTVGANDAGLNWYNSSNIHNKPGGSDVGWTLDVFNPDTEWVGVAHELDELKGNSRATLRLAIASNGAQGIGNQGFAFDNISFSKRTKLALLEYFTNSSDQSSAAADLLVDSYALENGSKVIDLQYHEDYPGEDPMNADYPDGASNRAGNLQVGQVPFAVLDGGFKDEYRYDFADAEGTPGSDELNLLSMKVPLFSIDLDVDWTESSLLATSTVTCETDSYSEFVQLFVVVYESLITAHTGGNGDVEFRNVVVKMLPVPGGDLLGNNWTRGESDTRVNQWVYEEYVEDVDDLVVVAFIQDRNSRQVLQAAVNHKMEPVGTQDLSRDVSNLVVYPNPAKDELYVNLGSRSEEQGMIEVFDLNGKLLMNLEIQPGYQIFRLDIHDLPRGMYMIHRLDSNGQLSRGKFIKTE